MEEFPSNSSRARQEPARPKRPTEERPKVEKVVTGEVKIVKKSRTKRFTEAMFSGQAARNVMGFVVDDIIIPSFRDTLADAVTGGLEHALYGEGRGNRRSPRGGSSRGRDSRVSYDRFSSSQRGSRPDPRDRDDPRPSLSRQARSSHNFDEMELDTRREGEEVIDKLYSLVDQYGTASVNDLYDLLGLTGDPASERYGWDGLESLHGATVRRVRGGFRLDLPRPMPL